MTKITIDKEKISQRIIDIGNAASELKKYQKMSLKEFLADKNSFPLASYWLRLGLEAVLTIATHLLLRLPHNGKKRDYTQVLISLGDYHVIPRSLAQKIRGMAGYRNRLVRLYWEIKPQELLSVIQDNLDDFDKFIKYVKLFIKKY